MFSIQLTNYQFLFHLVFIIMSEYWIWSNAPGPTPSPIPSGIANPQSSIFFLVPSIFFSLLIIFFSVQTYAYLYYLKTIPTNALSLSFALIVKNLKIVMHAFLSTLKGWCSFLNVIPFLAHLSHTHCNFYTNVLINQNLAFSVFWNLLCNDQVFPELEDDPEHLFWFLILGMLPPGGSRSHPLNWHWRCLGLYRFLNTAFYFSKWKCTYIYIHSYIHIY